MTRKQSIFYVTLLITTIFLLPQCSNQSAIEKADPRFTTYVAAYTSGIISNASYIRVKLFESKYENIEPNSPVDEDVFSFSPSIDGQAFWLDSRTIEFRPDERLPSNKRFDVTFHLSEVVNNVPSDLRNMEFQFQTRAQSVSVMLEGISAYSNNDLRWQKLEGELRTSDDADIEAIEAMLSAKQKGNALSISWTHDTDYNRHNFVIDSINRKDNEETVVIKWDGSEIGSEDGDKIEYTIPSLSDFSVMDIRLVHNPEQYLSVRFSDPLDQSQNLTGMVHIKDESGGFRTSVNGNELKLYPTSKLEGDVEIVIEAGIKNTNGYKLKETIERTVLFESLKPSIEIVGNGVILPSSNGLIFPFKAVNLSAVNVKILKVYQENMHQFFQVNQLDQDNELMRVARKIYDKTVTLESDKLIDYGQWNTFSLDLSKLIETEPGSIYRVMLSYKKEHSLYPCGDSDDEEEEEYYDEYVLEDEEDWDYYDNDDYRYWYSYRWSERDDPCKNSYYVYHGRHISRNVMASDLGVIAKGGDDRELHVAVANLLSTQPVSGANLTLYDYQNQNIGTLTTDGSGMAKIDLKRKPYLLVAESNGQYGYLRLDDGSALSMSMFDVGGVKTEKGIKGFVYGDRGVWRPGDSVYLSFILEDKMDVLPSTHPVVFELYDPNNQLYLRKVTTQGVEGLYSFRFATEQEDITGNYLAKMKVGGSEFTKTVKIETIKPNRLKINLDFDDEILSSKAGNRTGNLSSTWLHGAIARELDADVEVTMRAGNTKFDNYQDYIFDDPASSFDEYNDMLYDGTLDNEGKAEMTYPQYVSNAPGMLTASFKCRVFENSGDFSTYRFNKKYSPYDGYVGIKIPEGKGWGGNWRKDEKHALSIVTVDENGQPRSSDDVTVTIYKIRWRWWWERGDYESLARYVSGYDSEVIKTGTVKTKNGKGLFEVGSLEDVYGRLLIHVTDNETGHSTGGLTYVTWPYWRDRGDVDMPGGATMLTFQTDKDKYEVGDLATVTFETSGGGRALVSLENSTSVLENEWVETSDGNTNYQFKVTEDMAPNFYVHISLLQPHNQVENDLPIRLYGVQPVMVEDPATHLKPTIDMPETLVPEQEVTITVGEENGKEMAYTIAVVDEGLLDITGFTTPKPHGHFYARDALGVRTWDMYDMVLGAFTGEMAGLLALGGDEMGDGKGSAQVNRFKPVVKFLGPFKLKGGRENEHTFKMPYYIGSVKTMVVAAHEGAYGHADQATPVRKPLMVLATMPRVVGPSEKVKVPVTVFAMDDKIKNVDISLETNDMLTIVGDKKKSVTFSETGDKIVNFDLSVLPKVGVGKLKVTVSGAGETAKDEIEIEVRIPNPKINEIYEAAVQPGQTWDMDFMPVGIQGTNEGVLEVSSIPPINLDKRLKYLIRYPHGCIEQTTSSVFPQLHLAKLTELSDEKKEQIANNIKAGIQRLKKFQVANGGMSYWPGEYGYGETASEWGTNYAGHFLLEAKAEGYELPAGFLKNWIKFQTQLANQWSSQIATEESRSDDVIQAYRLYTLALAGKPAMGAMNRMKETDKLSTQAKWRLAAAYAVAGKKDIAEKLINGLETDIPDYRELSYSFGSSERDMAMILETFTYMDPTPEASKVLKDLAARVGSNRWYSTQTTAYSLLAIAKFVGETSGDEPLKFTYKLNGDGSSINTDQAVRQLEIAFDNLREQSAYVKNETGKVIFVRLQLAGNPLQGDEIDAENGMRMAVSYTDLDGNYIDIESLDQGTDFIAKVQISNTSTYRNYKELALSQIFPSGWEINNARLDGASDYGGYDKPKYQDIRDDRVYTYFDLYRGRSITFTLQLNAAYLGEYYLPGVYCEAMYDNEINALKAGKWVKVIKPGAN